MILTSGLTLEIAPSTLRSSGAAAMLRPGVPLEPHSENHSWNLGSARPSQWTPSFSRSINLELTTDGSADTVQMTSEGTPSTVLYSNESSENPVRADPTVDEAAVIPDLKPAALHRLDQVKVFVAAYLAKHDVANL